MHFCKEFLGHTIDKRGLHTTAEKVAAVKLAPTPKNQHELHSFLGLVHYYCKFIPNLATLLHPLNELLKTGMITQCPFVWAVIPLSTVLVPFFHMCTQMEQRGL